MVCDRSRLQATPNQSNLTLLIWPWRSRWAERFGRTLPCSTGSKTFLKKAATSGWRTPSRLR